MTKIKPKVYQTNSSQLSPHLPKLNPIHALPHTLQLNLHHIPIIHPDLRLPPHPHAARRPGEDHIPRQQRRALAQKGNRLRHAEDHVVCTSILHHRAVNPRLDPQILRILDELRVEDAGTEGRPSIVAFAEGPLASAARELPVAVGEVVADRVATIQGNQGRQDLLILGKFWESTRETLRFLKYALGVWIHGTLVFLRAKWGGCAVMLTRRGRGLRIPGRRRSVCRLWLPFRIHSLRFRLGRLGGWEWDRRVQ